VLDGLVQGGALAGKEAQQRDLEAWIAADAARKRQFGGVVAAVDAVRAQEVATRERDAVFGSLVGGQGSILGAASTIREMAVNRAKPDLDREPDYQERNWKRIREGLERMQKSLDPGVDRALLRYVLLEAARLPAGQRIEAIDKASGFSAGMAEADAARAADGFLDRIYPGTKLFDEEYRLSLLDKSLAELAAAKDSFLDLASALAPLQDLLREERKTRQGVRYRVMPKYMEALLAKSGGLVPPDANGTLRVTYGRVQGVSPKDGLEYKPQTSLAGILEKNTGEGDFAAPQRQLDAIRAQRQGKTAPFQDPKLGDVPVNFLSTVDTTGGSSGSATLNARGELCGLLFDGTYDSVVSDILFDPGTRSIHVDSRYLLWTLSEVGGAREILQELGF
jgi:hypothetical protein